MQARFTEPQEQESEIDAELIANRTIESLVKKDEEIISLKAQISNLTEQMENLKVSASAAPTPASEKEFKSMVAPPPPPPPPPAPKSKPKRQTTSASVVSRTNGVETTPSPSSPGPPPPLLGVISNPVRLHLHLVASYTNYAASLRRLQYVLASGRLFMN